MWDVTHYLIKAMQLNYVKQCIGITNSYKSLPSLHKDDIYLDEKHKVKVIISSEPTYGYVLRVLA
jgi:23S rRNA maturation-related 3'-5' exoribonuclease YhaM